MDALALRYVCMLNDMYKTQYFRVSDVLFVYKGKLLDFYRLNIDAAKKVREKTGECHNHKQQHFPDTKRKRKQTKAKQRYFSSVPLNNNESFLSHSEIQFASGPVTLRFHSYKIRKNPL